MRELILPRLKIAATIGFLSTGELHRNYVNEYYSSYSTMTSSTFTSFWALVFSISPLWFFLLSTKTSYKKNKSSDLSSMHWTRFFFKIFQHCETWNVLGLLLSYKLEEIELILFFKSCIIQIFVHQVCMNLLFYTVKLVESYKLYHTNRLM